MDKLQVEKIGGLTGFGLPGSKLKSRGERAFGDLSSADQAAVEEMFRNSASRKKIDQARDSFRYRITRIMDGQQRTVEVPETVVPAILKACVSDELI
jgi:chemotaxis receptor (MCP) glutamine deamidase CheD